MKQTDNLWIADGHCDSLGDLLSGKRDLVFAGNSGHWDLTRARRGKVGLQFMAAYIEPEYKPALATLRGLEYIESALKFIDTNREEVFLIKNKSDLERLGTGSEIGLLINIEGGEILGENLFLVDLIYRLGVRSIGLTWNQRNAIADGAGEIGSRGGLSKFGFEVISRMNTLGMLVDVSHINEAGFWDVIRCSRQPVIASHSCSRKLCDHFRNLTDQQLRALAEKKGMVGVNFCPDFLSDTGTATIDTVVDHICHIADTAGVDSVGFGSDFDGIEQPPQGMEDVSKLPLLIEKLQKRGFSGEEIAKISHGNFVRVLTDVLK